MECGTPYRGVLQRGRQRYEEIKGGALTMDGRPNDAEKKVFWESHMDSIMIALTGEFFDLGGEKSHD